MTQFSGRHLGPCCPVGNPRWTSAGIGRDSWGLDRGGGRGWGGGSGGRGRREGGEREREEIIRERYDGGKGV